MSFLVRQCSFETAPDKMFNYQVELLENIVTLAFFEDFEWAASRDVEQRGGKFPKEWALLQEIFVQCNKVIKVVIITKALKRSNRMKFLQGYLWHKISIANNILGKFQTSTVSNQKTAEA